MASASAKRMLPARRISCLRSQGGGVFRLGLEGVGADEFGEVGGLVGFGCCGWTHLVEVYFAASFCCLEGCFGSGEAAADNANFGGHIVMCHEWRCECEPLASHGANGAGQQMFADGFRCCACFSVAHLILAEDISHIPGALLGSLFGRSLRARWLRLCWH